MDNKPAKFSPNDKMRELVRENSQLILVLGRFGISLGFGDQSVKEVCKTHHVDESTFLEVANFSSHKEYNYNNIALPSLIDYLKKAHDYYLKFKLPNIRRKLIEAIDCSDRNDLSILILKFYDAYVSEVRHHMNHENNTVFVYVEQLLQGYLNSNYSITTFEGKHAPIGNKLKELKDVIIRCYPEKNNYLLNEVLLNIISCEEDLTTHCILEDKIFVPAVKAIERQMKFRRQATGLNQSAQETVDKEKHETLSNREKDILTYIAKGKSNKEIADILCLSIHTVATHRKNISSKLQIHTTAGLIIYAIANKLVSIEEITIA